MGNSPFFKFLATVVYSERSRHYSVAFLSVLLIFILSSSFFVSSSIRHTISMALDAEPDFVVQRIRGGRAVNLPLEWIDEIAEIHGVKSVSPRVHGRYFSKSKERSFLIIGIDFLDQQSHKALESIIENTDLKSFLAEKNMIVGSGVLEWLKDNYYEKSYRFLDPEGNFVDVKIAGVLPKKSNLLSEDIVIMPIDLAGRILGVGENEASDIVFDVPNDDEWSNVADKISAMHYDLRITGKDEMRKAYRELFNYKNGFFLLLFMLTLTAFVLLVYQRYNQVYSMEKRQIGIFRALGWSMKDILKFKFSETFFIVLVSYITGVSAAYFYVFIFDAPLIRQIFIGDSVSGAGVHFIPHVDFAVLASIFLLYALPFLASVLIPVWRIAVIDPREAMR